MGDVCQGTESCEHMLNVGTLHMCKAVGNEFTGGCNTLQCSVTRRRAVDDRLQAYRALDDCFILRGVFVSIAGLLGVSVALLLKFDSCLRQGCDSCAALVSSANKC